MSTANHFTAPLITANVSGMQKTKFTVYLSEPVAASVEGIMEADDRTFSNVVERVLKSALAERGDEANGHSLKPPLQREGDVPGSDVEAVPGGASPVPRSASAEEVGKIGWSPDYKADEIAAGTNGKGTAAKVGRDETTREPGERAGGEARTRPTGRKPASRSTTTALRSHRKPNRPAIVCPSKEFVDGVCQTCGYREG